jgi:hypothetical protein
MLQTGNGTEEQKALCSGYKDTLAHMEFQELKLMQCWNCDPEWPICIYDYIYKNKTNQQQTMLVSRNLSAFVVEDYFDMSLEQKNLVLVERQ